MFYSAIANSGQLLYILRREEEGGGGRKEEGEEEQEVEENKDGGKGRDTFSSFIFNKFCSAILLSSDY